VNLAVGARSRQLPVVSIRTRPRAGPRDVFSVGADVATLFEDAALTASAVRLAGMADMTLQRQIALASIPAPTGQEHERAAAVCAALRRAGMPDVRQDAAGNVIATRPATVDTRHASMRGAGPVVVMAHLDTVCDHGTLPALREEGSRVLLPGIGDNGRGLAALVSIAHVLAEASLPLDGTDAIELVATVGEEGLGNLRGARHYLDERARQHAPVPRAVIALDGPGDTLVVHHGIASRRWRISYDGPGGHPWADTTAANAVHAAATAMAAIAQLSNAQPHGVRITMTRMGGGESLTSIPMHAWFDLDLRSLDPTAITRVSETVRQTVTRASDPWHPRMQLLGDRPGGSLDASHPLVALAAAATVWQGVSPQSASASSDANAALARGIPAIAIGAGGSGGGAHTEHEWYDDQHGGRGLARALGVIVGATRLQALAPRR